jgi:hypothetical protein
MPVIKADGNGFYQQIQQYQQQRAGYYPGRYAL